MTGSGDEPDQSTLPTPPDVVASEPFGYADDSEEMTRIRLRQANLMGPAGYVSIDDSEVMRFSQEGVGPHPKDKGYLEMGGRECHDEDHMVTEAAVRAFYQHYRKVMGF